LINTRSAFLIITIVHGWVLSGYSQSIAVDKLRTEGRDNPLGIDIESPNFSWQIKTTQRGFKQSAFHLMVADDSINLTKNMVNIWNSYKQASTASNMVLYKGKKLLPAKKYYWKLKVWNTKGQSSSWSKIMSFTTGLFQASDWSNAKWIGYDDLPDSLIVVPGVHSPDAKKLADRLKQRTVVPLFRKEFQVKKKIVTASAFITGLGQYEMSINGERVGNSFLAPGWTHYDKRVLYNTYDITQQIKNGRNTVGVIVGNGFYNINRERYYKFTVAYGLPKMICKILVRYDDGSSQIIISDNSWKTSPSPIEYASIFGGEDYDATLEQEGWDRSGFDDKNWKQALLVKPVKGKLEAERDFPVKVNDTIEEKKISQPLPGIYVYDFGQNASGIVEVKVSGKRGQTFKLYPAELLKDSGNVNQNATGKPYYFTYTLKGDSVETWRPRFTYYGFRYVQLEGGVPITINDTASIPKILSLVSLHTGNSAASIGSFETSNGLFNRINNLIRWAIKSNLQSVVTDCPHREKLSWLEQDYLMGGSINANYDVYHLYKKLVYDMMDAQTPDGLVPDIAPEYVFFDDNGFGFRDSPEWGSASVIVPWLLYKWYGDKQIIRTAYPMMKKYVSYLKEKSNNHIISYGLGDWYDNGPNRPGVAQLTPNELTATAIYYYDLKLLSQMAELLNDQKQSADYLVWSDEIKKVFNKKFFDSQRKVYATGSQTSMAMPLCLGLVEEKYRQQVFQNLVDSINASGKKLTAGDIGFHFLVQALHEGGASQLLYEMNYRDDVPGYGFQLKKGATALTESWAALQQVSNNHLMLGHIMEWFYSGLAGINQSENSVGYKEIVIRPDIVGDINYVKGTHESLYGLILSEWKKSNNKFEMTISVPPNTVATVYLPANQKNKILENGNGIQTQEEIRLIGYKDGRAIIKIGSGEYKFTVE
jgi:hypothetical protein